MWTTAIHIIKVKVITVVNVWHFSHYSSADLLFTDLGSRQLLELGDLLSGRLSQELSHSLVLTEKENGRID